MRRLRAITKGSAPRFASIGVDVKLTYLSGMLGAADISEMIAATVPLFANKHYTGSIPVGGGTGTGSGTGGGTGTGTGTT